MKILPYGFYDRHEVLEIARDLLGKLLITNFHGRQTIGRIVETEAYAGIIDKASHAYGGRRTQRTEVMFGDPASAYVYLCYGIHHLFNVVSNKPEIPHATLVRAVEPVEGIEIMLERCKKPKPDFTLTRGPGNVSKALGIHTSHSGMSLLSDPLYLAEDGFHINKKEIIAGPRIGVDYAGKDALLPYRFYLRNNQYVSGKKAR